MNKQEQDLIDKHVKKISKCDGKLIKNPETGGHEVWVRKMDLIPLITAMIKELKELQ